jgi:hypothetical protein
MWKCLECGRKFRTVRAAERAANDGCPNCGGVDVDIDVESRPERPKTPPTILRPCPCGSGLESWPEHDARGIYLCRVCDKCRVEKLSHFRPEVLSDPDYEADEPIEEDQ